jgi:hypothetical protein
MDGGRIAAGTNKKSCSMTLHLTADLASEIHDETGSDPETARLILRAYRTAFERERSGAAAFETAVDEFAARFPCCSRSAAYRRVAEIICAADAAACARVRRKGARAALA